MLDIFLKGPIAPFFVSRPHFRTVFCVLASVAVFLCSQMKYSPELIQKTKDYFTNKHGVCLSDEQVIQSLDSLAELYQLFGDTGSRAPLGREPGSLT